MSARTPTDVRKAAEKLAKDGHSARSIARILGERGHSIGKTTIAEIVKAARAEGREQPGGGGLPAPTRRQGRGAEGEDLAEHVEAAPKAVGHGDTLAASRGRLGGDK